MNDTSLFPSLANGGLQIGDIVGKFLVGTRTKGYSLCINAHFGTQPGFVDCVWRKNELGNLTKTFLEITLGDAVF